MSLAIFAVRQQFGDTFDYGDIPNIKFGDYLIFKVYKPNVRENKIIKSQFNYAFGCNLWYWKWYIVKG